MGHGSDNRQRRVFVRIPVRLKAALREEELDGEIFFMTRDLSLGGIFLESDLLFDYGSEMELSFRLPDWERECRVRGRVAWTSDGGGTGTDAEAGMGVAFHEMNGPTREALSAFVQAKAGRVIYPDA